MSNFRVPYIVGNTPRRDHQMFPTILRSELFALVRPDVATDDIANRFIDQNWPFKVNLETIMQMAWRVREWTQAESSFEYHGTKQGGTWSLSGDLPEMPVKMSRAVPGGSPDFRDAIDERDILGPASDSNPSVWQTLRNYGTYGLNTEDTVLSGDIISGGQVHEILALFFGSYVIFEPETEMFYPAFGIRGNFRTGGTGLFNIVEYHALPVTPVAPPLPNPDPITGAVASDVQQGELTIISPVSGEILIPIGMTGGYTLVGAVPESGSVDLTITPKTWWPYANSEGNPVYNEDTGAQLLDPFS